MESETENKLMKIQLKGQKLYKMSHGSFKSKRDKKIRDIFYQNNWIVLHEDTGRGQGELFKDGLNAGDYLYITIGANELVEVAKVKSGSWEYVPDNIIGDGRPWIYREVEYLKSAINPVPSKVKGDKRFIYPSGNSTLYEIKQEYLDEANKKLFNPDFGVEFVSDFQLDPYFDVNYVPKTDNLPSYSHNIISYGPPGTGKTYNTIDRAVEIITGNSASHEENKKRFDDLREEGQIEFVTFHQNYGYEDFMIGIRPDLGEDANLKFKRTEGIFYRLCKRAEQNYLQSQNMTDALRPFDEVFSEFIEPLEKEDTEIKLKTISGKSSFWITDINPSNLVYKNKLGNSYTLSIDTLQGLYEGKIKYKSGRRSYFEPLVDELWKKGKNTETQVPLKRYVLIIDEINRANISKVFGELITLLEEDKRIGAKNELRITIPNEEINFGVPPNLYLIGTMNTADKSIALIDIALRRRFEFIGYFPDSSKIESEANRSILDYINKKIYNRKKSADYLIGHGYFMDGTETSEVLRNKVIPLLMEYFSGKTEVLEDIFKDSGWSVNYNTEQYDWQIQQ